MNPVSDRAPLHVLTLTPFFPYAANPVYGTYISEAITHFAEFNLRTTVIGVSPLHRQRRAPLPEAPAEWLRYPTVPGNRGLTTSGLFLYRRALPFVRALHQRDRIDVIHAHAALPCGHAASLLARHFRIPFVVTIHGLDVFNACFERGTRAVERRAKLSGEIYGRAASVICISRTIESLLKDGAQVPVAGCVIYNGTDPKIFVPDEKPGPDSVPTILMVGNLLRGKGHEIVLKAMSQVATQFPSLRCNIIGEGPDEDRFANLARALGISKRISFLGRQDRLAVATAMRGCTLFALPSRFEGLGCAYLEAMSCAKPVIACAGQGVGEIIQHGLNGWLIPVDGVVEMTDALRQLLSSGDLRTRIGVNARRTILDGLTLADQARKLSDLFHNVVKP